MARIRFAVGTRYLLNEQVYIVRQLLVENRLLVENQSFGGQLTVSYDELCAAWGRGEVRFEVQGRHVRTSPDRPISLEYTVSDLQGLPEPVREETWRRYQLLRPLLALPPKARTRQAIATYALQVQRQLDAQLDGATRIAAQQRRAAHTRATMGQAASCTSLERWLRAFITSGYDLRALVPITRESGGKGVNRLDDHLEGLLTTVLQECEKNPANRTAGDVVSLLINRVADENRLRSPETQLPLPSRATIYRRIADKGVEVILRRQKSRLEQHDDAPAQPGPHPSRILERVEMDHTTLDIFLVDEEDRLPIGRPTLTYALDVYCGYPFGIYVGFEPASYRTVQQCLLHAILPKADTRTLYGTQHDWPTYGLPETLVVDNGREFIGRDLDDACGQLGIILERMPVRTPWFKGSIERFFRSNNTGLLHSLPGTTFSNVIERGDYDVFQHACISLSAFWQILHIFLLDIYAQRWHEGKGTIPAKRWAESVQSGFVPCLHNSADEVRILLYRSEERTIQRSGIDFEALRYQDPALARLRSQSHAGTKVRIKYDPADLSSLYVLDPTTGRWIGVPAVDQEYTHGLSLWKHRVIRSYVLRQKQEVDIYALAKAKQHIQEIVAHEFLRTRKSRGRKTAARFLNIEEETTPTSLPPPPPSTILGTPTHSITVPSRALPPALREEQDEGATSATLPVATQEGEGSGAEAELSVSQPPRRRRTSRKTRESAMLPAIPVEAEALDTTGWSGDYNLPQHASRL
jgi:putative transposase